MPRWFTSSKKFTSHLRSTAAGGRVLAAAFTFPLDLLRSIWLNHSFRRCGRCQRGGIKYVLTCPSNLSDKSPSRQKSSLLRSGHTLALALSLAVSQFRCVSPVVLRVGLTEVRLVARTHARSHALSHAPTLARSLARSAQSPARSPISSELEAVRRPVLCGFERELSVNLFWSQLFLYRLSLRRNNISEWGRPQRKAENVELQIAELQRDPTIWK